MKIQKLKIFVPQNMEIINFHPFKTRNFKSQEDFKEIRNFLPFTEIKNFCPYKTGSFESKLRKSSK